MAELIDKGAITFRCRYSGDCRGSIEACFKCRDYVCDFEDIQDMPTVTEAEIRYKAITDFLQFVCDNANNEKYANEDGWALSDLIDLEFKYLEQLKERE